MGRLKLKLKYINIKISRAQHSLPPSVALSRLVHTRHPEAKGPRTKWQHRDTAPDWRSTPSPGLRRARG